MNGIYLDENSHMNYGGMAFRYFGYVQLFALSC